MFFRGNTELIVKRVVPDLVSEQTEWKHKDLMWWAKTNHMKPAPNGMLEVLIMKSTFL